MDQSFDSLHSLSGAVDAVLESGGDLNMPLAWVRDHVQRIITEPLCTSHVLGSELLDRACIAIGTRAFESLQLVRSNTVVLPDGGEGSFVYLVTKVQKSGGHTKVIQEFIRSRPAASHVVLSTELDGPSDLPYFLEFASSFGDVRFEKVIGKSNLEKLQRLQVRLMQLRPQKVYLFNHHQDSVLASAVVPNMGLDAYFCHHADHHLCLGVFHQHLKHIDLHPMGYNHCRMHLQVDNLYVPLAVPDLGGPVVRDPNDRQSGWVTCTAGRSNKLEVPYFVQYADMVWQILQVTGGQHVHIGMLSKAALQKIRSSLRQHGLSQESFVYVPWVPSVWKALQVHQVDLYIASFPYGGGLTLLEAMGAGVPVVLHQHLFSEILSGIDLAYEDAFAWRYPQQLLEHLRHLTRERLQHEQICARREFEKFYDSRWLPDFLIRCDDKPVKPRVSSGRYRRADDEWGLWMEQQVNLKHWLHRSVYRWLKNLRTSLYR